jgi:hypothetical protein
MHVTLFVAVMNCDAKIERITVACYNNNSCALCGIKKEKV